ncbi:MAG: signal transduction histidine kinase, partial [Nitrososphaeraceae archaeon]|nr:signal transduction histidine kinase [Nitrososphaeraceae archaeon]MDF2770039.1 signal transduction histidine kinase [Nitrososphaeraceae archaeon]
GNINSQFLVAYNKNATLLANGANQDLVGEYFFGEVAQKFINHNEILNNSTRKLLLAGNSDYAVYDYGKGERLTTGYPIFVNTEPKYFLQIVTPTKEIYAHIGDVLFIQRIRMFSFLAGATTAAIAVLIVLLAKWNVIVRKEVKRRTRELEESYDDMKVYLDTVLAELKRNKTVK